MTGEGTNGWTDQHVDKNQRVKIKAATMVAALRTARLLRNTIASAQGKQENEKDKVRTRKTFVLFD